jgi:RHS repeat-associated protein
VTLDGTVMFTYHYNTFDRLVQVDDVNGAAIGRYYDDPFGRRLWKQAGGETTLFFYSDEGLVAEYDPTGADIRSYGYRPGSTWTTDPLWLQQNGEYYFYHNDHLGTPQKLVQQNGAVVWSATYEAFGKAQILVNTVENNLRFPGQYFDAETGLHYNCFRYYASGIGRYLRHDPFGLKAGLNLFVYAQNNPLMKKDSLGLYVDCDGIGITGTVGTPIPKLGGSGSASLLKCHDDSGSYGVFLCFGGGFGVGLGLTAGVQWTRVYVQTICELDSCGVSPSSSAGGGYGPGIGIDTSSGMDTILMGGGFGGFGGSASLFSCCLTIFARNKCGFPICGPKPSIPEGLSAADAFWYNYYVNQPR